MAQPNLSFDRFANDPANAVSNVAFDLTSSVANVITLPEGTVFYDTVTIVRQSDGVPLDRDTDFFPARWDHEIIALTGKRVAAGIYIEDGAQTGTYLVSGQMVGGYEGKATSLIEQLLAAIQASETGTIPWARINAPATFPSTAHTHSVLTLTELEELNQTITGLEQAFRQSYTLKSSGVRLAGRLDRVLSLLGSLREDLNTAMAYSSNGLSYDFDALRDSLNQLAALVSSNSQKAVAHEDAIGDLQTVLEQRLAEAQNLVDLAVKFRLRPTPKFLGDSDLNGDGNYEVQIEDEGRLLICDFGAQAKLLFYSTLSGVNEDVPNGFNFSVMKAPLSSHVDFDPDVVNNTNIWSTDDHRQLQEDKTIVRVTKLNDTTIHLDGPLVSGI